jgi:hypothetical protein
LQQPKKKEGNKKHKEGLGTGGSNGYGKLIGGVDSVDGKADAAMMPEVKRLYLDVLPWEKKCGADGWMDGWMDEGLQLLYGPL